MTLEDQFKQSERDSFIKQIADKLFQGIRAANDRGESRRWIWELVQNAKDVPNKNGQVSIRVTIDKERLEFEHNGDPFTISSLTGILQQVSDKAFTSTNEKTTGKFGTGFITTHILGTKIELDSILAYDGGKKKFNIILDRAADRPEELIEKIKLLMQKKDDLANNTLFPPLPDNYIFEEYETRFSYKLSTETQKFAEQGVQDLERLSAYALLYNKKIKQITIVNKLIPQTITIQRKDAWSADNGLAYLTVAGFDSTQAELFEYTVAYRQTEPFVLSVPVTVRDRHLVNIKPLPGFTPTLFKDFPLIGTEKWLLPLVCNCSTFEPTEPRDGLYLHQEGEVLSWQVSQNRKMVKKAVELTADFVELLAKEATMPKELFLLCRSELPKKETHEDVLKFLLDIQGNYRSRVKKVALVLTVDGYKPMAECRFPIISDTVHELEVNKAFYKIVKVSFANVIPIETHYEDWLSIISENTNVWGEELPLRLTDLLSYIQNSGQIEAAVSDDASRCISWLNEVYSFLIANGYGDSLRTNRLLLNQDKNLISINDAQIDELNVIPELLKDCGKAFEKNYRSRLLFQGTKCDIVTNILTIEVISNELNGEIGRLMVKPSTIIEIHLTAAARLCNVVVESSGDDRRIDIVQYLGAIIPEWREHPQNLPQLRGTFNFDSALKAVCRYCLHKISLCGSINSLTTTYGFVSSSEALRWLDNLVRILGASKSDIKALASEFGIFPNQLGELGFAKDLLVDEDSIVDFIKDMHQTLKPAVSQRQKLLSDNFDTQFVDGKYNFREMAYDIDLELDENYRNRAGKDEEALKMIDWTSETQHSDYRQFFPRLASNKAFIVLDSLPDKKEPVFRLLRLKPDFEKLTAIAESEYFDLINEIAQSNVDIAQLNRLCILANELGGIDELEAIAASYIEEQTDLQFQKNLGTHVEELFRTTFSDFGDTFQVERKGYEHGQDFALIFATGLAYRIEIKSFASGKERVHMSIRQGETAAKYSSSYALCVLERPGSIALATKDYFKANAVFVADIGKRLKPKVDAASEITDLIKKQQSEEESIAFDSTAYKFRIGKRVWSGRSGLQFNEFIAAIRELVNKPSYNGN